MNTDQFNIINLEESPEKIEQIIIDQQTNFLDNQNINALLTSIYLCPDRDGDFNRFLNSLDFKITLKLMTLFGVRQGNRLCEIGGGPGFFVWALQQSGYSSIELVEPNNRYNTGTGYLRTRKDSDGIVIHSDLSQWHHSTDRIDVVITKNCIHHFKNISQAAAAIRQKMNDNAIWIVIREQYADTPKELYNLFLTHPYCQPFGTYEWAYPPSHYVESIEIAGFRLEAVVPLGYANNCLCSFSESPLGPEAQRRTGLIDQILTTEPGKTVESFWDEVAQGRRDPTIARRYSRPQMMMFRRIDV
jgi:hypothetical protein